MELETGGEYQWRRDGEPHLFSPEAIALLQHATRTGEADVFARVHAGESTSSRPG